MDPVLPDTTPVAMPQLPSKKKYIIIGGILALVVFIIPLAIGFLTPTSKVVPSKVVTKNVSPVPSDATNQSPLSPTNGAVSVPDDKVTPYFQITPVPTIDLDTLISTKPNEPTPTPLPGPFFTANSKQNDLFIRLYQEKDWDQAYQVQLINTKTHEVRVMGYQYLNAPGDSAYFSHDFATVIFLGGKKNDVQMLSFYSIPFNAITSTITLKDMKSAIPELDVKIAKTLSRLVISPDGKRAAISYGYTYNVSAIEPTTDIIVCNLQTKRIIHLNVHGLVKDWKDDKTLEYEQNDPANPAVNTTLETPVPAI